MKSRRPFHFTVSLFAILASATANASGTAPSPTGPSSGTVPAPIGARPRPATTAGPQRARAQSGASARALLDEAQTHQITGALISDRVRRTPVIERAVAGKSVRAERQDAAREMVIASRKYRAAAKRLASEQNYKEAARAFSNAAANQGWAATSAAEATGGALGQWKRDIGPEGQRVLGRGLATSARLSEHAARMERRAGGTGQASDILDEAVSSHVGAARAFEEGKRPIDAARQYVLAARAALSQARLRVQRGESFRDTPPRPNEPVSGSMEGVGRQFGVAKGYLLRAYKLYGSAGRDADADATLDEIFTVMGGEQAIQKGDTPSPRR